MTAIPEVSGMKQVIIQPENGSIQTGLPIISNIISSNDIRLTKNMKLRLSHKGITEIKSTFQSGRVYIPVMVDSDVATQYGLDSSWIGETLNFSIDKDITPFPLASATTSDSDLIDPVSDELSDDKDSVTPIIKDLPGKTGGKIMTSDNYLTLSSHQIGELEIPADITEPSSSSSI